MSSWTPKAQKNLRAFFWTHGILAVVFLWGRLAQDGTLASWQDATANKHYHLPGTNSELAHNFTGIGPVDQLLRSLIILFWAAIDGSSPATTAAAIYFAGQIFPMAVAMYLDGLRAENGAGLIKTSLWFELIGVAAIGCVAPIWGAIYTSSMPTMTFSPSTLEDLRSASLISSPRTAMLLLPAFIITYLGPLILMGSPSATLMKWAIIAWNLFPIGLIVFVKSTEKILDLLVPSHRRSAFPDSDQKHMRPQQHAHIRAVRLLGAASVVFGFIMHVSVTAASLSSVLFPWLFREEYVHALSPMSIFSPPFAFTMTTTLNDGALGFIKWDQIFGYLVVMVVYLAHLQKALSFTGKAYYYGWWKLGVFSAVSSLILGPGTTIMAVSWLRDEVLYSS